MDKDIITNFENLYRAYKKAKLGKSHNGSCARFQNMSLEGIHLLKEQLENQTYQIGKYSQFKIYEPKERVIMSCSFKDKVVQHCLGKIATLPSIGTSFAVICSIVSTTFPFNPIG